MLYIKLRSVSNWFLKSNIYKLNFQISDLEKGKLESAMGQFDDLCRKFDGGANGGVEKLCTAAFRPKLKSE